MLIPVIMAGGVGSRLWPASREARPKQFLAFAGTHSLFQQSLLRLQGFPGVAAPVVVCNEAHRFLVAEQLREIGMAAADIILEPAGRNTAPAVALAALCALERSDAADASLLVLAADHLIPDIAAFHAAIAAGLPYSNGAALVTFGIVPLRAETGYGYIQRGAVQGSGAAAGFTVQRFVEKPDQRTAQSYVDSGEYYWNSGMFMFRPRTYLEELGEHEPMILHHCRSAWQHAAVDLDFRRIPAEDFMQAPAISIDYAVMERTRHAVVVPLDAGWTDLGAWSAVWEQGPFDAQNNVAHGDVLFQDSCNSFVQADSRLVAMVGMDNAVVVETADAVLVANKARVQEVKDIVQRLNQAKRSEAVLHRKVYRPWGSYEGLAQAPGFQVKRIVVKPGAALSLQLHHKRAEHWIVVRGVATVTCGDDVFDLSENESTYIPMGVRHRLENRTSVDVCLIEVQCGSYLGEDDIVRFEDVYGRAKE
jgi:mannose-1-phosphate guanylyltransferase/mannose-6-phosphate isomerase